MKPETYDYLCKNALNQAVKDVKQRWAFCMYYFIFICKL